MNTLTRLALVAAFAAAPLAACTEPEAENAAYETGEAAENAGAEVAATTENVVEETGDAARDVAAETEETVDEATTTPEER
ncbi:hypothetical protein [Brevundimonas sp.]|uniref:hypothetical protein n=1 Tax=Brevundimonas sp. TaxID=1871086 RepID=UPI0027E83ED5|nr:hypothetical protein [Brevundimonas sp.]MDQ7812536.1 hypothetical protein [Brevundimonas sp.]